MAKVCQITGKKSLRGNNVSHAHNKTKKVWGVNLQSKRVYDPEAGKWVRLKVSARALRSIDKLGLKTAKEKFRAEIR